MRRGGGEVVIGVDPHKRMNAVVVINAKGTHAIGLIRAGPPAPTVVDDTQWVPN